MTSYHFDEQDTKKLQTAAKKVVNALSWAADYYEELTDELTSRRELPTDPQTIVALVRLIKTGTQFLQSMGEMGILVPEELLDYWRARAELRMQKRWLRLRRQNGMAPKGGPVDNFST